MSKFFLLCFRCCAILVVTIALGGCGTNTAKAVYPEKDKSESAPRMSADNQGSFFSSSSKSDNDSIGVNAYLWRASLDTVAFMPISSADPFGGTIITDWYQLPEGPAQRYKLTVLILDRVLRADGVKVSVFKQTKDGSGQWTDAKVDPKMAADIENSILTRARQLRIATTTKP
jgi:Domain of unknown function (DUF3576)